MWSTEEETHLWTGHFWISKFGTVPGSMNCVEKKFEFQVHKWEEYRGTRYYTSVSVTMLVNSIELLVEDFHLTE